MSVTVKRVGLHRVTVKKWLLQEISAEQGEKHLGDIPVSPDATSDERRDEIVCQEPASPADTLPDTNNWAVPAPSAPWASWDQVNQARETLHDHRFLLLRHPKNVSTEDQAQLAALLSYPVPQLALARSFLIDWYALWKDGQGCRRTVEEAKVRYDTWRSQAAYLAESAFRRVLSEMTDAKFDKLSAFLRHPHWEATNNGAERFGRAFRHEQAPHFNLRTDDSISAALAGRASRQKAQTLSSASQAASRSTRGRKRRPATPG